MSSFFHWLRVRLGGGAPDKQAEYPRADPSTSDLLEQARALARDGRLHDASRAYSRLPRKQVTVQVRLEHADVLLSVGDRFGAASNATRVLEVEPENARAHAIRREVLRLEEAERKG